MTGVIIRTFNIDGELIHEKDSPDGKYDWGVTYPTDDKPLGYTGFTGEENDIDRPEPYWGQESNTKIGV